MKYQTPPKEVDKIFNREWTRAKRLGKPHFDNVKRPYLYVSSRFDNTYGKCYGSKKTLWIHLDGMRKVKTSFIIILKKDLGDLLIPTIRHEICHVAYQNHGRQFKMLLRGLNRDRDRESDVSVGRIIN